MVTVLAFVVLAGGTAFAATQILPKNSVGTKQIKNNAITGAKIKDGAVSGAKISTASLGTVPSATHADSATTATSADPRSRRRVPRMQRAPTPRPTPTPSAGYLPAALCPPASSLTARRPPNQWEFGNNPGPSVSVTGANGGSITFTDTASRAMQITGIDVEQTSKSIAIQCGSDFSPNLLFCFAQVSPGT